MFKEIVKSLSDTEIVVISKELNNPNISNESILNQLLGKSNAPINEGDVYKMEDLLLCLCDELSNRLLERDAIQIDLFKDEISEVVAAI